MTKKEKKKNPELYDTDTDSDLLLLIIVVGYVFHCVLLSMYSIIVCLPFQFFNFMANFLFDLSSVYIFFFFNPRRTPPRSSPGFFNFFFPRDRRIARLHLCGVMDFPVKTWIFPQKFIASFQLAFAFPCIIFEFFFSFSRVMINVTS